jgi:hypothetical protein
MANITEILGTDSVSSSRPTINSNFELLNDELASVTALLNPTTSVIENLTSATTNSLTVNDNGNLFVVTSGGAICTTSLQANGTFTLGGKFVKSGSLGTPSTPTTTNAPSSITKSNYFIDADFTIPTAVDGVEVTLLNVGSSATAVLAGTGGVTLGATSISLDGLNSTVTLRCFENKWFVISSNACTIS